MKAMLVLEKVLITGNDKGEISVIRKSDFGLLLYERFLDYPVLKLGRQLYAIMAQYKDPAGTIAIL